LQLYPNQNHETSIPCDQFDVDRPRWGDRLVPPPVLWAFLVLGPLVLIGFYNVTQIRHTILRNFPVLGYFRYFFESIAPETQQYFIERHTDGRPFSRQQRTLVYTCAKNVNETVPFGTQLDLNAVDYEGLRHSIYPVKVHDIPPRVRIGDAYFPDSLNDDRRHETRPGHANKAPHDPT